MRANQRRLWLAFVIGLAASGALGANCNPESVFACETDEDCLDQGEDGRCEPGNVCSFPDEACPNGRRWHHRAPIPEADMCMGAGDSEDGESETAPGDDSTSDADDEGESTSEA
jgi:hypothetical protein